jgi:c-di-GMP-binding flagellar brake protein YcgR
VEFTHEDGVTGKGTLSNVSLGGCAVRSETPVSDAMLVTLRLTPSEGGVPIVIEMGRVRWATTQEFGVEFMMVLQKERKKLDQFLRAAASAPSSTDAMPSQAA